MGTLAASMQCWWMAQVLRSHSRWWWLVVCSDEMPTAAYDLKEPCFFCGVIDNTNTAGPIKRPSSSTITFLHHITGSVASCYKSHRLSTSLRPLNSVVLHTTIMRRLKFVHTSLQTFINCHPWRHQLVMILYSIHSKTVFFAMQASAWRQCKQACEATYRCQRLKAIYIAIMPCASQLLHSHRLTM